MPAVAIGEQLVAEASGADPGAARWRGVVGRVGRSAGVWPVVLAVVPVLVLAVPALAGRPVLPGDDLTQSFPLRVLVGSDLAHGVLPVYDPYLWSGAPLLAGWNAGAAYPLTWVFAVLPGVAAWTVGLVVTWWVAGLGLYAFLGSLGLTRTSRGLGALTFCFGGAMAAQVVHVGLVEGMSWVPLQLLAVARITEPGATEDRSAAWRVGGGRTGGEVVGTRLRWASVLAAALALTVLAGEPRAVDDAGVVVVCFATFRLARLRRRLAGPLVLVVVAFALGAAAGAIQWVPGLYALSGSQRSAASSGFFGAGSLPLRWLGLLLVPDLLGGSGSLGQPSFLASYNLTEVSGYVGVLPVAAAFGLLGTLRRRGGVPEWAVWYVIGALGALLALGASTPVGTVLARIPLYGAQRLQSRNLVIVDLALAVLLGYFLDAVVTGRVRTPVGRRRGPVILGVAGAGLVAGTALVGIVGGGAALGFLGAAPSGRAQAGALAPFLAPFLALALVASAVVAGAARLRSRGRSRLVTGVVTALVVGDLCAFDLLAVVAVTPGGRPVAAAAGVARGGPARSLSGSGGKETVRPLSSFHAPGRFAVYDPRLLDPHGLTALGVPDGNVVTGTPSVLGYGSIVDGRYAAATGSHGLSGGGQDTFLPEAAENGTLDELETSTLVAPPSELLAGPVVRGARTAGRAGDRVVAPGERATWLFGRALPVLAVEIPVEPGRAPAPAGSRRPRIRVGVLSASGGTRATSGAARAVAGRVTVRFARPEDAVGVVAMLPAGGAHVAGVHLGAARVVAVGGAVYLADGPLEAAVVPPRWRYVGTDGPFGVFRDTLAAPPLRLVARPRHRLARATVRVVAGPAFAPTAVVVASASGAEVVRAVSDIPGSVATWRPVDGGRPRVLGVRRRGLVQAVVVPPGKGTLTFGYLAPGLVTGEWSSLGGVAGVAVLAGASALARRASKGCYPATGRGR